LDKISLKILKVVMMKKRVLSLIFASTLAFGAEMVNGIAFTVNDNAITLFELYKTMGDYRLNRDDAMAMLVDKTLQKEAMEKYEIKVEDEELNSEASRIVSENGMSLEQFKSALRDRNIAWDRYSEDLREKIKKEHLYRKIASEKIKMADEEELKNYYESNIESFSVPRSVVSTKYYSQSKEALIEKITNPNRDVKGVDSEDEEIDISKLNPQFVETLLSTKNGAFTPIVSVDGMFISFLVHGKKDLKAVDFERAKNMIFSRLMSEREGRLVSDYFEKQRALAKVNIIRLQ